MHDDLQAKGSSPEERQRPSPRLIETLVLVFLLSLYLICLSSCDDTQDSPLEFRYSQDSSSGQEENPDFQKTKPEIRHVVSEGEITARPVSLISSDLEGFVQNESDEQEASASLCEDIFVTVKHPVL